MTTLYKYNVWCTNTTLGGNDQFYTVWNDTEPTKCVLHSDTIIDATKTFINDQVSSNVVVIQQEAIPSDGGFQVSTLLISCPASSATSVDWSFPYPVTILGAVFVTGEEHQDDVLDVAVSPNSIVGVLTANATIGQTVFNVNSTVTTYTKRAHRITITDFVNTDNLGVCLNHSSVAGTITTSLPTTHAFSAGTPTYIRITPVFANNIIFGHGTRYEFGNSVIKANSIPANKIVRFTYTNNGNIDKTLKFQFQYMV